MTKKIDNSRRHVGGVSYFLPEGVRLNIFQGESYQDLLGGQYSFIRAFYPEGSNFGCELAEALEGFQLSHVSNTKCQFDAFVLGISFLELASKIEVVFGLPSEFSERD